MEWKGLLEGYRQLKSEIAALEQLRVTSPSEDLDCQIALLKREVVDRFCPPERYVWEEAEPILDKLKVFERFL
jgi:hypothetical protein